MILAKIILWMIFFQNDIAQFQMNRYQIDRYESILKKLKYHERLLGTLLLLLYVYTPHELSIIFALLILFIMISRLQKIELKITNRVKRMELCLLFSGIIIFILDHIFKTHIFFFLLILYHEYVFLIPINIMQPLENKIRLHYQHKTQLILKQFQGIKIGITGSYGKTSVKTICDSILKLKYYTLSTPYSYNNAMGISKTVLNHLDMHHEVFICEMGADHLHEIEDLSKMVQPSIGIITSIGPQHLETFQNIQNILHEKMQLIESLPAHGIAILNYDNHFIRQHSHTSLTRIITVGINHPADYQAIQINCDSKGSQFDVMIRNQLIHFETRLLGKHQIINLLIGITLADYLKIDIPLIQTSIQNIKPVPHRLELKPFFEATLIDNSYNSNPESARYSLETLSMMPKRHICITPGFIDLGKYQDEYSFEFGKQLAQVCDLVILIKQCPKIVLGLEAMNYDEDKILHVTTMKQALEVASALIQENDTILIENDIPEHLIHS